MPLKGEAKKAYNKRRYLEAKASDWATQLAAERRRMKKALHGVEVAEGWKNAGEEVNENALSLAWQWNAIVAEEKAKEFISKDPQEKGSRTRP